MTVKKPFFALVAAVSLTLPSAANAAMPSGYSTQPRIIAILIGLLLPAVQKAR